MEGDIPTNDSLEWLEQHWKLAAVDVFRARSEYENLQATHDEDDPLISTAWLRLWRAQELQRQLAAELDAEGG